MEELAVLSKVQTCFLETSNDRKQRLPFLTGCFLGSDLTYMFLRDIGNGRMCCYCLPGLETAAVLSTLPANVALHHITSGLVLHGKQKIFKDIWWHLTAPEGLSGRIECLTRKCVQLSPSSAPFSLQRPTKSSFAFRCTAQLVRTSDPQMGVSATDADPRKMIISGVAGLVSGALSESVS
jgi:hypothetical protein